MLILLVASFLLLILYILLLFFYRSYWLQIPVFHAANKTFTTTVTVLVPARNEEKNLPALLSALGGQDYPADLFSVFVIDDHSTDQTPTLVRSSGISNCKLISLRDHVQDGDINSYKKKALETGIKLSHGSLIVTTDADCTMGAKWLSTIVSFYEKHKPAFIAAPVSISYSNRFIEIFQAVDFMTLQGITGASVHKKKHSMCNGANMAFERAAFVAVDGYKNIDAIASGDDMLLMHKIYKRYPKGVMFLKSPEAIVSTQPVRSVREFFNQRIRWASKADKYDDKRIIAVLLLVYLVNLLLVALPVIALFKNPAFELLGNTISLTGLWLILIAIKTVSEAYFLLPVAAFFHKQRLLWLFPIMQPFHILYTVIAGWLGKFGTYRWKERQVK